MDRAGVCLSVNGIVKVTLKEIDTLCTTGERGSKEETRGERGGGNLIVHGLLEFSLSLSFERAPREIRGPVIEVAGTSIAAAIPPYSLHTSPLF